MAKANFLVLFCFVLSSLVVNLSSLIDLEHDAHEDKKEQASEATPVAQSQEDLTHSQQQQTQTQTQAQTQAEVPVGGEKAVEEEHKAPATKPKPTKLEPIYMPYVVIGTGTAAFAAANAIRERDPEAQVLMIGDEGELPYNRTPLSKELWHTDDPKIAENLVYKQWDGKERRCFFFFWLILIYRR
jgi:hypothetical protein